MKKEGCEKCGGTGYRGRLGLHEIAVGTPNLKKAIKKRATVDELRIIAIEEGMRSLIMDGIQKIFQGLTDLSQVLRVCSSQTISES
jgi:type II secretory ATPase GspE/PulE/Tfp pilus assembly ATPase PilB-like protein